MDAVATLRDRPARVACALLCLALNTLATPGPAQVDADQEFDTAVARPAFAPGEGPTLRFDEAHRNLHTASGRYAVVAAIAGAGDDAAPAFARGEIAALVAWIEAGAVSS